MPTTSTDILVEDRSAARAPAGMIQQARAAPAADAGPLPVAVQLMAAKPNALFTEEQRQLVRFLRYSQAVPCAECGRRSRTHWTFLVSFQALTMPKNALVITEPDTVHLPLAPVCRAHLLKPAALPHDAPKRAPAP